MNLDRLKAIFWGALKSWTIRFNAALAIAIGILPILADTLPGLQPYLPPDLYKWAMLAVLLANLALRFRTDRALGEK